MLTIAIALAAAAYSPVVEAAPASARGGFDPLTAAYKSDSATYCIRSGWRTAAIHIGRPVRAGDCRTAAEWRRRGIAFEPVALIAR